MRENIEPQERGRKVSAGVLVLGPALAAAVAAIGYRSLDRGDSADAPACRSGTAECRGTATPRRGRARRSAPAALGLARFSRSEYDLAAAAYRHATEKTPDQAVLWSALGEALVMASERDPMPAEALAAFREAAQLDPADPRALFFRRSSAISMAIMRAPSPTG